MWPTQRDGVPHKGGPRERVAKLPVLRYATIHYTVMYIGDPLRSATGALAQRDGVPHKGGPRERVAKLPVLRYATIHYKIIYTIK